MLTDKFGGALTLVGGVGAPPTEYDPTPVIHDADFTPLPSHTWFYNTAVSLGRAGCGGPARKQR